MLSSASFTVLQQRQAASLKCVELCNTMDLIAIVADDALSVFRTLSWERVYYKKASELLDSGSANLVQVSFSPIGKYLAVAFQSGEMAVVNVESEDVHQSVYSAHSYNAEVPIISLRWYLFRSNSENTAKDNLWRFGGVNQQLRGGMKDEQELIEEKKIGPIWLEDLSTQLAGSLLLSLRENYVICGHVFGIYPLFTLDASILPIDRSPLSSSVLGCFNDSSMVSLLFATQSMKSIEGASRGSLQSISFMPLREGLLFGDFFWSSHATRLQLNIELNLGTLRDIIASSLRKWKEATKVVLPKLQLLQGVLDTYELQMSPVQFLYSVSLCGLWHPAAATAFSQHWADAGIERLRSGVESVHKEILSGLQLRAVPLVNNITLDCRELLELYSANISSSDAGGAACAVTLKFHTLLRAAELLTLKLDETLIEARVAGESMLLYIQFVKDCYLEASETPDSIPTGVKPDLSLRPKYHHLLDPRRVRAELKGPASQQQAEHLTASHLYAYLSDAFLPAELVKSRLQSVLGGNTGLVASTNKNSEEPFNKEEELLWREIVEMGDDLSVLEIFGEGRSIEVNKTERIEFARRSLVQQIKSTSEAFKDVVTVPHAQLSNHLTTGLQTSTSSHSSSASLKYAVRVDDHLQILSHVSSLITGMCVSVSPDEMDEGITSLGNCLLSAYVVCGVANDGRFSSGSQLLIVLQPLTGIEDNSNTQLLCCRMNLEPLLNPKGGTNVFVGSEMAVYVRPAEEDGAHPVSVLFTVSLSAATLEDTDSEGTYLVRINLTSDLTFTELSPSTDVILISAMDSLPCVAYDNQIHQCRRVSSKIVSVANDSQSQRLWVSGDRGVALLSLGGSNKIVVLDLEATEDEDDDEDGGNEESEHSALSIEENE